MHWNLFSTFVALLILGGSLYRLFDIWEAYANRPKCRCAKVTSIRKDIA